jgi:hypothetical protein
VQPILDAAMALAETYCDRKFMEADEVEQVVPFAGNAIRVIRYPITSVASIVGDTGGAVTGFHVSRDSGVIFMNRGHSAAELTVSYKGGYAVLPDVLLLALWALFDSIWAATPGAGAAVGAGGSGSGDIERITIPDVGSISYRAAGSGGGSSGSVHGAVGFMNDMAAAILNMYRRESL